MKKTPLPVSMSLLEYLVLITKASKWDRIVAAMDAEGKTA